jgi:hypothetical protein
MKQTTQKKKAERPMTRAGIEKIARPIYQQARSLGIRIPRRAIREAIRVALKAMQS